MNDKLKNKSKEKKKYIQHNNEDGLKIFQN